MCTPRTSIRCSTPQRAGAPRLVDRSRQRTTDRHSSLSRSFYQHSSRLQVKWEHFCAAGCVGVADRQLLIRFSQRFYCHFPGATQNKAWGSRQKMERTKEQQIKVTVGVDLATPKRTNVLVKLKLVMATSAASLVSLVLRLVSLPWYDHLQQNKWTNTTPHNCAPQHQQQPICNTPVLE